MVRHLLLVLAFYGAMVALPAFADDPFGQNNPDVNKYEFARSYITGLGYMKDIDGRWQKNPPEKAFAGQKNKIMMVEINDLSLDSADLLIFKNYMRKYLQSSNMLMRKVADMVVVATSREVAINHEEKELWEKWYDLNAAGQATSLKEIEFLKSQDTLELRRKAFDTDIVHASVLMTKVLISDKNKNGKGHLLAISAQQRQKLLDKLDSFGADTLDWGLKSGQTTMEGSIAVIREILEDSIWISSDEK